MRTLTFTAGLFLATQTAFAQSISAPAPSVKERLVLATGCVYAPNLLTQDNAWSLIYTEAGTTVQCALSLPAHAAPVSVADTSPAAVATATYVTRAAAAPIFIDRRPRNAITPRYMVGVFR